MVRRYSTWLALALAGVAVALFLGGCRSNLDPPDPYSMCSQCNWMQTAAARHGTECPMP